MSAGNATPSDASTMWKPSVNAIWLRAGASCEAARERRPRTTVLRVGEATSRSGRRALLGRRAAPSGRDVLATVDLDRAGPVQDLGTAAARQVVPAPVDERLDPVARAGHQDRVDAQPCEEGGKAVQLAPPRADLGERGAAPDHGHDALVAVRERPAGAAVEAGEDVLRRPHADLEGHGTELGQRPAG